VIERFVQQASTYAGSIDNQILLITVLVGFWFLVAEGVFFWLIFKFRRVEGRRSQYITGEQAHEKRWVSIPHYLVLVCDIVILVGALRVWYEVKQTLPQPDRVVRVIAQQWAWTFVDPGPDGLLDTEDDIATVDEFHVEVGKTYHFRLTSKDVIHSFSVPVFRLKQDAVPGREIVGWFKPTKTGTFDVQCAEICGIGHGIMGARIHIDTSEAYAAWVKAHAGSTYAQRLPTREATP
jgi:cytochrome c oxidase subunit 2